MTWWMTLLCVFVGSVFGIIVVLFFLTAITRLVLGIEKTNLDDLKRCVIIGVTNKVNALMLVRYKSPSTDGAEMTRLRSAIDAENKLFLINPVMFALIVKWTSENNRDYSIRVQHFDFSSKMKLLSVCLSAKYLLWVAGKKEEATD